MFLPETKYSHSLGTNVLIVDSCENKITVYDNSRVLFPLTIGFWGLVHKNWDPLGELKKSDQVLLTFLYKRGKKSESQLLRERSTTLLLPNMHIIRSIFAFIYHVE